MTIGIYLGRKASQKNIHVRTKWDHSSFMTRRYLRHMIPRDYYMAKVALPGISARIVPYWPEGF